MKRCIRIVLKEEINKRFNSFLEQNKEKLNNVERLEKYFSNHVSKLVTTINDELKIEDIRGFQSITKENVLYLISLKSNLNDEDNKYLNPRSADSLILYIDFLNIIFLENNIHIKYEETELYKKRDVICPICGTVAKLQHYLDYDNYYCPKCHAKASVHKNSNIPTSVLAGQELRLLRKKVYSVVNSTFNNKKDIYPFIAKILPHIDFNHVSGYIGLMAEKDCNKVINFCNYLHEMKVALQGERKIRINHYRLSHYFLKNATLEQLRIASLIKKNYPLYKIAELLKLSMVDLIINLYIMYGLGASLGCRCIISSEKLIKDYVVLHHDILAKYFDDDIEKNYQNITRANVFMEIKDSTTLYHIIAYYHRIELIKRLRNMSDEEFETYKLVK